MNSEISRMAFYEAECKKKDELIGTLKEELALYQKNLREKDYKLVSVFAIDQYDWCISKKKILFD